MKNIFNLNLILAVMLMFFTSCSEDFLDKAPLDELTVDGAFNTKADAELIMEHMELIQKLEEDINNLLEEIYILIHINVLLKSLHLIMKYSNMEIG